MGPETVATLVIVGIIVLALALYVFAIALGLKRLSFTLGTIIVGLRAIKDQTRPANQVLGGILNDVTGIESDLEGLLGAVGEALGAAPAPSAPSMQAAVAKARTAEPRLPVYHADDEPGEDEEEYAEEGEYEEGEEEEEPVPVGAGSGRSMSAAVAAARARLRR